MKETDFRDRVPQHPGRVKMIPVQGEANTYDMERADSPLVEGTPINKATLDSIPHSRLTGRFYKPNVERTIKSSRGDLTVSPIPVTGWVYDESDTNIARNGSYIVQSDSNNGSVWQAAGAFTTVGWQSSGATTSSLMVSHTAKIKVHALSFILALQYTSRLTEFKLQGSNDGITWTDLYTTTAVTVDTAQTYTLTTAEDYSYYRLLFTSSSSNRVTVSSFRYTLYDMSTYENVYTELEGMPEYFTAGQRVSIETPSTVSSLGVISNTFNSIAVNTILQPSKRYELVYNGVSFDAKEV